MKEADLTLILVFALLAGGIFTFIGGIVKYFNSGDILNWFDEKKQDKEKVSKKVGGGYFYMGLSIIFISLASIFINERYYNTIMGIMLAIVLIGNVVITYIFFKCCKKDK